MSSIMTWHAPKDAMPWVGLYVAVASLICTLAMVADAFQGFRHRKLWFPCKFFTINAATITLIAIAMKLPVDLSTDMPSYNDENVKTTGIVFLFTMLVNFLPSLGGMGDKELLVNIIALGILVITIIVNTCIQEAANFDDNDVFGTMLELSFTILILLLPFWVVLTVPASRRFLEHQYQELHILHFDRQKIKFSSKELIHHVKKYWMMAETGNPQFVLASSPISSISGLICSFFAIRPFFQLTGLLFDLSNFGVGKSDYKWSIDVIRNVQNFGILLGSIAPIFRCITTATYFNLSILWSINHINIFRVEKHWTQRLRHWKRIHVTSHIPGRHSKKVFNHFKNMILNICMALQIVLVVLCKTIWLIPRSLMILLSSCCHFCYSLVKKSRASNINTSSEIEEYTSYVLGIEGEAKLSNRMLKNILRSITKLVHESEKKQPQNLIMFLEKSTGLKGVIEFDIDQVPPLHPEETHNCWSLVAVTLTVIGLALPNIENGQVKRLLASMSEGLQVVRHIEETLNANEDLIKARKTARRIWTEADIYRTWVQIDLQKKARKGKTSKEILQWLGDEAVKTVIQFKKKKKRSADDSLHKFIAASSMYKISQTMLLHCNEQEDWPTDEELFEWISSMIADILCACFTNLPRVIILTCHHDAIEKREESIRTAARLLGKSKRILNILEARQLPDLDQESMAYIDNWHALPKSQIPNGPISSAGIQSPSSSSSSNESVTVTIM